MAKNIDLNIRLKANKDGSLQVIRVAGNDVKRLGDNADGANTKIRKLSGSTLSLGSATRSLGNSLSIVAGLYTLKSLGETLISDTADVQNLTTRLRTLTKESGDYAQSLSYISTVADSHHKNILVLADSYAQLRNLQNSGLITQQRTQEFFEGLSNAASALGASNEQLKQTFFGLSQSLSILNAENFNQVMEPLPGLLQAMDKAAGLASGGFRKLVTDGKASTKLFSDTLAKALKSYDGAASAAAKNIDAKTADISNSWTRMILKMEEPISLNINPVLESINSILKAMTALDGTALIENTISIGKVIAAVYAGSIIGSLTSYLTTKAAAIQIERAHSAAIKENLVANVTRAGSLVSTTQAKVADLAVTESVIVAARADAASSLKSAQASIAAAKATISATNATIQSTGTKWINKQATDALTLAEAKRSAIVTEMAVLGQQQARVHVAITEAELAQTAATKGLATAESGLAASSKVAAVSLGQLLTVTTLVNVALAAFVGWEIGKWARREFEIVRVVALTTLGGILTTIENLKLKWAQLMIFIGKENRPLSHFEAIFNKSVAAIDKNITGLVALELGIGKTDKKTKKLDKTTGDFVGTLNNGIATINGSQKAFQSQIDKLIEQNILLTAGEKALSTYIAKQKGFTAEQIATEQALSDANAVLVAQKTATEKATKATEDRIQSYLDLKAVADEHFTDINQGLDDEIARITLTERAYFSYANQLDDLQPKQKTDILAKYDTVQALKLQEQAILSLKDEMLFAFDEMLFSGASFTEALGNMFDSMIDRMLSAAAKFATDNLINGLFSGNLGQTALGLGAGALVVGVSALLNQSSPQRSDIQASNTTTRGDSRALGFAEIVATDIAARDYIFARQLEAFNEMNTNLKLVVSNIKNVTAPVKGEIKDFVISATNNLFDKLPIGVKSFLTSIKVVLKSVKEIFSPLSNATDVLAIQFGKLTDYIGVTTLAAANAELATLPAIDTVNGSLANSGIDAGGVASDPVATKVAGRLGALAAVLTAGYNVYSLVTGFSDLDTKGKVLGIISTLSAVLGAGAAVASTGALGSAAAGAASGLGAAAGALAAVATVGLRVFNIIENGFTAENIGGVVGAVVGGIIGTVILPGVGTAIGIVIGDLIGSLIGGLFGPDRTPNSWFSTNRKAEDPGFYTDPNFKHGDRVPGADPKLWAITGNKDVRVGVNTPFGQTVLSTHETGHSKQQGVDMFGKVLLAVYKIDTALADVLNKADGVANGVGETMQYFIDWQRQGNTIKFKQNLDGLDIAEFLSQRYLKIVDVLGESGTATGVAFDAWVSLFKDKFGPENILGIIQNVAANFEGLTQLPLELVKLLDDNIKSFDLGGTPEDAVTEMNAIVTTYSLLGLGLDALGATNISDVQIVEFLAKINSFGFAVSEGGASILQYSQILALMGEDIGTGLTKLFAFADEQKFNAREFSNFFSTTGAFVSLGSTLGVTSTFDDLVAISNIIDDIATATLDKAAIDKLSEQTSIYGKNTITVEEARKEIEALGLATGDAILQVVNEVVFMSNTLEIMGTSFAETDLSIKDVVASTHNFIEVIGGIKVAQDKFNDYFKHFYSHLELLGKTAKQTSRIAQQALNSVGVAGLNTDNFRATFEALLPELLTKPELLNKWLDLASTLGKSIDAQKQLSTGLEDELKNILTVNDATTQRYQTELDYISRIRGYVSSLLVDSNLSPLTNAQRLAESKAQFSTQLSAARAGDTDALGTITNFAKEFLQEARSFYASGADYQAIFNSVTGSLSALNVGDGSHISADAESIGQSILDQTLALVAETQATAQQIISAINNTFTDKQLQTTGIFERGFIAYLDNLGYTGNTLDNFSANYNQVGLEQLLTTPGLLDQAGVATDLYNNAIQHNPNNSGQSPQQVIPDAFITDYFATSPDLLQAYDLLKGSGVGIDRIAGLLNIPMTEMQQWLDDNKLPLFAKGGIATSPSIFGDAGAEAAVPLPDGRSIPVTINRDNNDKLLQALIAEVKALRQDQANYTDAIVDSNMDASEQSAEKITQAVRKETQSTRWVQNKKVELV